MACASCGGGKQLTPNKGPQGPQMGLAQSPNRIVVTPGARSGGQQTVMKPNGQTKRTQV